MTAKVRRREACRTTSLAGVPGAVVSAVGTALTGSTVTVRRNPWAHGARAGQAQASGSRRRERAMAARYEYKVEELREGMIGGKMSGDKLEKTLNAHAREGWQIKAITSVDVKGRIGPGSVEGILVTFERPLQ